MRVNINLSVIFLALFLLDIIKPFGYSLRSEFLFLGVIFVSLRGNIRQSLTYSIIAGYLKDSFIPGSDYQGIIGLPVTAALIHYFSSYFSPADKKNSSINQKIAVISAAILVHIIINSIYTGSFLPVFSLIFLIQTLFFSLTMNYLLNRYIFISD